MECPTVPRINYTCTKSAAEGGFWWLTIGGAMYILDRVGGTWIVLQPGMVTAQGSSRKEAIDRALTFHYEGAK